ncbi:hypothetical protein ACFFU8_17830 [Chromobacterium piscinae]|uniref:hypothetical protein n=1 Tax=Chromobacterium piscinae TaxID=686831 RepID=UPI001E4C8617|nr:hypothetical protein [Chromobacterium piscinae]MCD5329615.1 hypothetical protein [Chromobacterium piscinae]
MDDKPQRGGARQGAGRKTADGASGLVPAKVMVSPEIKAWLHSIGQARIRAIFHAAHQAEQRDGE